MAVKCFGLHNRNTDVGPKVLVARILSPIACAVSKKTREVQ